MTRRTFVPTGVLSLLCLFIAFFMPQAAAQVIVADHNSVDQFEQIPDSVIQAIENDYLIFYGHTSHGSQIMTGISLLYDEDPFYDPPNFQEYGDDLGHNGDTSWVPPTRNWLDAHPEYSMVMWSWCGGCSDNTEGGINLYLNVMNGLEQDYPGVTFIYMTGHLDGSGPEGILYARNNQIRDYCVTNDKILFDFADIESYDPDGNYYPEGSDACEWCYDWCAIYTCPSCGCAHSHCFNCYLKGKAWWWMMARIWGWTQDQDSIPHVVSTSPAQNEISVPIDVNVSVTFDIPIDETTINESTFVVNAWSTGLHEGTITYNSGTKTATLDPTEDFVVGEIVTVVLTTDIQSSLGFPLDNGYVWSFTTEVSDESPGSFVLDSLYTVGRGPHSVFASDLDGDGNLDLVVTDFGSLGQPESTVSILMNGGNGTFQEAANYPAETNPRSVFCADLNRDSAPDLAVVNRRSNSVSVLMNNGNGTFQDTVNYRVGSEPLAVSCADLNGDAALDLAVGNAYDYDVSILLNDGQGAFPDRSDYPAGAGPASVFSADLDRDGDLDLAVANFNFHRVTILFNDGGGTFQDTVSYPAGDGVNSVFCADLNGDTALDLAISNDFDDNISVRLNNGDGIFQDSVNYPVAEGEGPSWLFCADLNGDSALDLAVSSSGSDSVSVLFNKGDGTFCQAVSYETGSSPYQLFCADMDEDGDLDIALANYDGGNVSILLNCLPTGDCNEDEVINVGDVVYLVSYLYRGGPAPDPVGVGDVNCDGIVNVGDVVYLVSYLYRGGAPPVCC